MAKKQPDSNVLRVGGATFRRLGQLKAALAKKNKLKKMSYDSFLFEVLNVAEILIESQEVYSWQGQIHSDVSEVWSKAVEDSILKKTPVEVPRVLIDLGQDNTFEVPGEPK